MPRYQSHVVKRVYDWPFQMHHHLEIVVILDVVALNDGNFPIHYHVLGVERAEDGAMIVDDFHIEVWDILRRGQLYFALGICILRCWNWLMVV